MAADRDGIDLLDMIWPETGMEAGVRMPTRPKDAAIASRSDSA